MVDEGISILNGNNNICQFGELLKESWMLKRGLSSQVSNDDFDEIMRSAGFYAYDVFLTLNEFLIKFDIDTRVKHKGKWGYLN